MNRQSTRYRLLPWTIIAICAPLACSLANAPDEPVDPAGAAGGAGGSPGPGGGGSMPECESSADCADGEDCTVDACEEGSCTQTVVDPDDGDACTVDSCDSSGDVVNDPVSVDDNNACTLDSCDPITGVANVAEVVKLFESWDAGPGAWIVDAPWEVGPAKPSSLSRSLIFQVPNAPYQPLIHDPGKDHTPSADEMLAGVVIGGFVPSLPNLPFSAYLESAQFDGTITEGALVLRYWRWLASDYEPFMINTVEVRDGDMNWQEIFNSGPSPGFVDAGWRRVEHDITAFANAAMKIRFGLTIPNNGYPDAPGWSVDDISVVQIGAFDDDGDACTASVCDPTAGASSAAIELDDQNACTADSCDPVRGLNHRDATLRFVADFGSPNHDWTLGPEWQVGAATAFTCGTSGTSDPGTDTSITDDNGILGVVLGGCYSTAPLHPYYYATSPLFNAEKVMSGQTGAVTLELQRWLGSDYPPFLTNQVEFFDGSSWVVLWSQPQSIGFNDTMWQLDSYDLSAVANPCPMQTKCHRLRIGFTTTQNGVYSAAGWNLDDIVVRDDSCVP